jgi:MFS family permease
MPPQSSASAPFLSKSFFVLVSGILAMALATGIGRFGYTPLLPVMQAETGASALVMGAIATANYVGHLVGAVMAARVAGDAARHRLLFWGLAVTAFSMAPMALGHSVAPMALRHAVALWMLWRFIAGVSGAWVFVLASALVVSYLHAHHKDHWGGWHFGGVGLGMALSGLIAAGAAPIGGAALGWAGLAVCSVLFGIAAWRGLADIHADGAVHRASQARPLDYPLFYLVAAYGCQGLGYVVTGTYLVAQARSFNQANGFNQGGSHLGDWLWVLAGAANLPSTAIWSWAARHVGHVPVLVSIYLIQAVGAAVTALVPGGVGLTVGAALFGLSFMGGAGMTLSMGRAIRPTAAAWVMGRLTFVFGIGQMIGPLIAAQLSRAGDYSIGLGLSAIVLGTGALLLIIGNMRKEVQGALCEH